MSSAGGCVALAVGAVAGAGAYAYHAGKLTATLDASLARSYDATRSALKDLELTEASATKDAFEAKVLAKTADAKDVTVRLEKKGETVTDISIRIGTFGDEPKSTAILAKIRERL
jgi:hypothetical protein